MIVVRVELWSAVTGRKTELARLHICNVGGTSTIGNYDVTVFRGRSKEELDRLRPQRTGNVQGHPRLAVHVWNLVAKALASCGYGERRRRNDGASEAA